MTEADALVLTAPRSFEPRRLPVPEIGDDDGILRIEACGLCGTDHEQYTGLLTNRLMRVCLAGIAGRKTGITDPDYIAPESLNRED